MQYANTRFGNCDPLVSLSCYGFIPDLGLQLFSPFGQLNFHSTLLATPPDLIVYWQACSLPIGKYRVTVLCSSVDWPGLLYIHLDLTLTAIQILSVQVLGL